METINLQNDLNFSFEKLPDTIRLIISKNNEEWACRKEKLKNLISFLEADEMHIFKGRLQLFKSGNKIDIQVKNKKISSISTETFQQALDKLK
ncbi:hypothetical protein [Pedobacter mendelii]|uniref:Uncharacterized protein n=1 Tax=Pedobacter mendelii TaxID=1908240 RepID=A0ABQ2BJW4_9SPHI|nr:hypothetical protein [Pedobacter mendelii]GGI25990.1 hypothetical protein GCM10008119_20410 [Pedobacter mendelii]